MPSFCLKLKVSYQMVCFSIYYYWLSRLINVSWIICPISYGKFSDVLSAFCCSRAIGNL